MKGWAHLAARNERVVTGTCGHCGGTRHCPSTGGCDECARYQQFTQSRLCGACQGTGLSIARAVR